VTAVAAEEQARYRKMKGGGDNKNASTHYHFPEEKNNWGQSRILME